jgi:hypothetical protein
MLPAHEVATIVRSAGFVPLSPAFRRGETYVIRATRPDGREVRVMVDARRGQITSAVPVAAATRGGPPRERLGAYERMDDDDPDAPDGYIPPPPRGVYQSGPPVVYEGGRPLIYDRRPAEPVPNARGVDAPPPIVREGGGEPGLLPPPPERFPPRAAPPAAPKPAAKPAPVKRASAAPPLPKPKPAAAADASAPADAEPQPQPAPERKPDARELPH